jgi:hypothetical protein
MKNNKIPHIDLAGRLKDLEHFTGQRSGRDEAEPEAIPVHEPRLSRVPVPRRSRVFLRHGEGHGVFAELTLTAPRPRPALD